jgi:peptidyl-prolyl cis-trans isomerase SurA
MKAMQQASVRRKWIVVGALMSVGLAGACGTAGTKPKTFAADVWAVVDGREIHRDEVEKAYRGSIDPAAPPASDDEILTAKLGIVDGLITQEILLARARALGLEVTDAEVETAFTDRKRALTDAAFQQQLSQRGLTVDDMKRSLRRELSVQKVVDRDVVSKITISDQDVSTFYTQNRAQFNLAETQYRIAQIVITPVRDAQLRNRLNDDATTPAEADRKVQMLSEKIKAGVDFGTLATDYSEDPQSAPQGGDLGFIPASALNKVPAALRDVVLKSEPGNVRTVSQGNAYTIVMLVAREAAGQRELSAPDVREGIRDALRQRKEQLLRTAYLAAARSDAQVTNILARQVVDAQSKPPSLTPAPPGK